MLLFICQCPVCSPGWSFWRSPFESRGFRCKILSLFIHVCVLEWDIPWLLLSWEPQHQAHLDKLPGARKEKHFPHHPFLRDAQGSRYQRWAQGQNFHVSRGVKSRLTEVFWLHDNQPPHPSWAQDLEAKMTFPAALLSLPPVASKLVKSFCNQF